ncbi:hypothetical protein EBR78_11830 [bacterium]|nr:hypothetical protein [bacterium]
MCLFLVRLWMLEIIGFAPIQKLTQILAEVLMPPFGGSVGLETLFLEALPCNGGSMQVLQLEILRVFHGKF